MGSNTVAPRRARAPSADARGFSLLEVLVAVAALGSALGILAQLFWLTSDATARSKRISIATILATEKMEQLRGLAGDLSVDSGASLTQNVDGFCDFFDARGRAIGTGPGQPEGTSFVRRWSIAPLSTDPAYARVLHVVVVRPATNPSPATGQLEVRLVTVKVRKGRL